MPNRDNVNHPQHYTMGRVETIEIIDQVCAHYPGSEAYSIGAVLKYLSRAPHKNSKLDDLRKAAWYLKHVIARIESKEQGQPDANYWHTKGLIGGDTRWRQHVKQGQQVLGVHWDKLPLAFRRKWWKATDYGRHPDRHLSAEAKALAADLAALEQDKREIVADTARATELIRQAQAQCPCEQCLRPAAPCQAQCLRVLGVMRVDAERERCPA